MDKPKIIYYPHPQDEMWNQECEVLIPYLFGKRVDIGSACRSIFKGDVRVDIDEKHNPDVLCSGDELPFKDGEFDCLYSIHSFEHFNNQSKLLTEWARVIRRGGIIALVHPDVNHTGIYRPDGLRPGENPYNKHEYEKTYSDFFKWFKRNGDFGLKIIDSGVACPNWSFYIILKKKSFAK